MFWLGYVIGLATIPAVIALACIRDGLRDGGWSTASEACRHMLPLSGNPDMPPPPRPWQQVWECPACHGVWIRTWLTKILPTWVKRWMYFRKKVRDD